MASSLDLLGVERLTVDYIVEVRELGQHSLVSTKAESIDSLEFIDRSAWPQVRSAALQHGAILAPGGCVANALVAARIALLDSGADDIAVGYAGPCGIDYPSRVALRSLRDACIDVEPWLFDGGTTETVCVLAGDEEPGRVASINVALGSWPAEQLLRRLPESRYLLIGLDTVLDAPPWLLAVLERRSPSVMLMLNQSLDRSLPHIRLRNWISANRISLVVGRATEISDLMACLRTTPAEFAGGAGCVVVETLGAAGVRWHEGGIEHHLDAAQPAGEMRSHLGAGDALAGATIAAILNNLSIDEALSSGQRAAAEALSWFTARPPLERTLRSVFQSTPLRDYVDELQSLAQDLTICQPPVIISGGQTGVDELALHRGALYGFPTVALFPAEYRREITPHDFATLQSTFSTARLEALTSKSYQVRTWATAFLADATVLFNWHHSEGSLEAAVASKWLRRRIYSPSLEADAIACGKMLASDGAAVVNFAGNRGSLLSHHDAIGIDRLLSTIQLGWAREREDTPYPYSPRRRRFRHRAETRIPLVGIPSSGAMNTAVVKALSQIGASPLEHLSRRATMYYDPKIQARFIVGRSRDLGRWLRSGFIDIAVAGYDELREGGYDGPVLFDTRLFSFSLVLVSTGQFSSERRTIVSQIPNLARQMLSETRYRDHKIVEITGAAEAWLALGAADLAVDTWQTGRTARANNLIPIAYLGRTSLCIAGQSVSPAAELLITMLTACDFTLNQ
jgi:ATP phosphoribosyltransferase